MSKKNKIIIIIASIIAIIAIAMFIILYTNGYSGLHNHKKPSDDQIKVACIGDSITYGHGISGWAKNNYPAQLQALLGEEYHVSNFGHSGRTLSDNGDQPYTESEQYALSQEYGADVLVIMLGTNDSKPENWKDADTFIKEYEKLVNKYKENNPNAKIILCTPAKAFHPKNKTEGLTNFDIQPAIVDQIRTRILAFALLNGYECVDIYDVTRNHSEWFSDNVHPSKDGAAAIAKAIAAKIK